MIEHSKRKRHAKHDPFSHNKNKEYICSNKAVWMFVFVVAR